MSPDRDQLASAPPTPDPGDDASEARRERIPDSEAAPAASGAPVADAQSSEAISDGEPADEVAALRDRLAAPEASEANLRLMSRAERHFDGGDNRQARALLDELLARRPVDPLERAARALRGRIRPDRVAVGLFLLSLIGLIVIWILAVTAFQ